MKKVEKKKILEKKKRKKKKGKTECTCAVEQFEKYEEIKTFLWMIDVKKTKKIK